jgi:hypothetical protein
MGIIGRILYLHSLKNNNLVIFLNNNKIKIWALVGSMPNNKIHWF